MGDDPKPLTKRSVHRTITPLHAPLSAPELPRMDRRKGASFERSVRSIAGLQCDHAARRSAGLRAVDMARFDRDRSPAGAADPISVLQHHGRWNLSRHEEICVTVRDAEPVPFLLTRGAMILGLRTAVTALLVFAASVMSLFGADDAGRPVGLPPRGGW